jgi:hypothetical protein
MGWDYYSMSNTSTSLVPSPERRALLRKATDRYAASVETGDSYLASRGISLEIAAEWRLGVVEDPLPGHEKFKGRLSIPYDTPNGPVAIVFRCIEPHDCKEVHGYGSKYLAETGEARHLYNVRALRADSPVLVLCEGELDALVVSALAGLPAVGVPGAKGWKAHYPLLFDGHDEVILAADGDTAGTELAETVRQSVPNSRIVTMPAGLDANSFIVERGPEVFRQYVMEE